MEVFIFNDYAEAEDWCFERENRALGCPDCQKVHADADAFVCCGMEGAVPLVFRNGRYRPVSDIPGLVNL